MGQAEISKGQLWSPTEAENGTKLPNHPFHSMSRSHQRSESCQKAHAGHKKTLKEPIIATCLQMLHLATQTTRQHQAQGLSQDFYVHLRSSRMLHERPRVLSWNR